MWKKHTTENPFRIDCSYRRKCAVQQIISIFLCAEEVQTDSLDRKGISEKYV
jgi:hypothetical protein